MKQWTILCLAILTIFSCKDYRNTQAVMDRAESLMNEAPDSSLALLNGVDRKKLTRRGSKARFTLLLSMAQHKCYMDMSADTCLRAAYEWYQQHGSERNKMLSAYYLGLFHEQAGGNIEAVLAFAEAESLAQSLQDYRQLSLIEQHLSEIFDQNYDNVRALDYAQKSLQYAMMAQDSVMEDYCRYDVAVRLLAQYRYEEAGAHLSQVLQNSKDNPSLYSYAAQKMAAVCFLKEKPDIESAKNYYQEIIEIGAKAIDCHDFGLLAGISEYENKQEVADSYLAIAESMITSSIDSLVFYNDCRNVYDTRKDWERAHEAKTKSVMIQDRMVIQLLGQSISHAMKGYYEDKWELEKVKSRSRLYVFSLLGILVLLAAAMVSYFVIRKNRSLLEDMAKTQDLSKELVNTFVADKISDLQRLSESFFSWEDNSVKKREGKRGLFTRDDTISSFRMQLSELRNDHTFITALEQSLNISESGIMTRSRQLLPNAKELDYTILTLLFSGFSIMSISFLLRMSEASLRMRKTRYKQKFSEFPEPERSLFLEKLG